MPRPKPRRLFPKACLLEARQLLSTLPAAVWDGQDGHDLAGGSAPFLGNGVQDVHIALTGLPTDRKISSVSVLGHGGGGWNWNLGGYSIYTGALVQPDGSSTADLYVEPIAAEVGREFDVKVTYDDQSSDAFSFLGGAADPNLRMPADAVAAQWMGQDGQDLTGNGPSVGPDGVQDAHIVLTQLFPGTDVTSIALTDATGKGWAFGTNAGLLGNAEFVRDGVDPSQGSLYFNPSSNLNGTTLGLTLTYADGKIDHATLTAGATVPTLAVPSSTQTALTWNQVKASWVGQDGLNLVGQGDVHVALSGIPAGRSVTAVAISDVAGLSWSYSAGSSTLPIDPGAGALGYRGVANDPTRADLSFPPGRNEAGSTLTFVVLLDDGTTLAGRFAGGSSDPGLRVAGIASTSVNAHPGDDLNDLANRFGTVHLASGTYALSQPLVLNQAVTITADPGTTLLFSQGANDSAWTAAIKVRASHTTLNGFSVRFGGPIRWSSVVSYGPAVVGTSDDLDPASSDPLLALTFSNLDLQSPPTATSWEEAPHLFRLVSAGSGQIVGGTLRGGVIELQGGPWQVVGNRFLGTVAGSFASAAIATHSTHDLTITDNYVAPAAGSGKLWRFLVMTQSGVNDVVRGNTVVGVGPMDSDVVANPNAAELFLTESYRVHFEGLATSVSADGLILQTPAPQNGPVRPGDVVAILSGPDAGQWRRISQVLPNGSYLLDARMTPGAFAVSIVTGFVNERFESNLVDSRGSSTSEGLVMVGNQFGASVVGNHWIGGLDGFRVEAYPSESPNIWGWTHAPVLGLAMTGNTLENTVQGGSIDVSHGTYVKSDVGRVYLSGTFRDNTGIWTDAFLAARPSAGVSAIPGLVTVGQAGSSDPGELWLSVSNNRTQGAAAVSARQTSTVVAGTINGLAMKNTTFTLQGDTAPTTVTKPPVKAPVVAAPLPPVASTPVVVGPPAVTPVVKPVVAGGTTSPPSEVPPVTTVVNPAGSVTATATTTAAPQAGTEPTITLGPRALRILAIRYRRALASHLTIDQAWNAATARLEAIWKHRVGGSLESVRAIIQHPARHHKVRATHPIRRRSH